MGGDGFGPEGWCGRVGFLKEIGRAESGAVNRLKDRLADGVINQGEARVDGGVIITVLVIAHARIEVQIGQDGEVALQIKSVVLPIRGNRSLSGNICV